MACPIKAFDNNTPGSSYQFGSVQIRHAAFGFPARARGGGFPTPFCFSTMAPCTACFAPGAANPIFFNDFNPITCLFAIQYL